MKFHPIADVNYAIRLATKSEIHLLGAIEGAAGTIFPQGTIPENVLAERIPHDVFADAIDLGRLLVAVDSAQVPVGYALWQTVDDSALLAQMDVHPLHGRKGLGRALVLQSLDRVRQAGFPHCYLTTFSDVPWNAPFYQKLGFVILAAESQPDFMKDILHDEQERGLRNRVAMLFSILLSPYNAIIA